MPTITISKFRGIDRSLPPFEIEDGRFKELQNLIPSNEILEVRPGRTRLLTQIHATAPVTGLDRYYHAAIKETLASVNGALYSDKTAAWATINGANPIANGANLEVLVWKALALIQDEANNGPYQYDGTTFGAWANAPKAKYLMLDRERVYVANIPSIADGETALQASDLNDHTTWTLVPGNASHGTRFYVGRADGDVITGLKLFGSMKFIFKNRRAYGLEGDDRDSWALKPVFPVGAVNQRVIQNCGDTMVWTDGRRVYAFDGQTLNLRFGWPVEPLLAQTTLANWKNRCAAFWNSYYILFFSPTQAVVHDFRTGEWTGPWTYAGRVATVDRDDDEMYFGGASVGEVYRAVGTTDDGTPISWAAETKHYDFGDADPPLGDWVKRARRTRVMAAGESGTITTKARVDDGVAEVSRSMAFTGTGAKNIEKPLSGPTGLHHGLRLEGTGQGFKGYEMSLTVNRIRRLRQAS